MRDPFARSFLREITGALVLGAIVTCAVIIGLTFFTEPDPILVAENNMTATEPVTEDTPGPVIHERAVLDNAGTPKPTLSDRDR